MSVEVLKSEMAWNGCGLLCGLLLYLLQLICIRKTTLRFMHGLRVMPCMLLHLGWLILVSLPLLLPLTLMSRGDLQLWYIDNTLRSSWDVFGLDALMLHY